MALIIEETNVAVGSKVHPTRTLLAEDTSLFGLVIDVTGKAINSLGDVKLLYATHPSEFAAAEAANRLLSARELSVARVPSNAQVLSIASEYTIPHGRYLYVWLQTPIAGLDINVHLIER